MARWSGRNGRRYMKQLAINRAVLHIPYAIPMPEWSIQNAAWFERMQPQFEHQIKHLPMYAKTSVFSSGNMDHRYWKGDKWYARKLNG